MQQSPPPKSVATVRIFIFAVFVFVVTMMTFVNAVDSQFVNWDDDVYVVENPHIGQLDGENIKWIFSNTYYYSWIPLTLLSHAGDVAIWGLNPKGHHLTNIFLHASNGVWLFLIGISLFRFVRSLEENPPSNETVQAVAILLGSGIGALLYATHPLRVEPVAWVSGRKDLLCTFFLLPAFWFYIRWKEKGKRSSLVGTHILFALALMSKPMAAPFPLILAVVDFWLQKKKGETADILKCLVDGKILLLLLSATTTIITLLGAQGGTVDVLAELNTVERFLFPAYAIVFYLWKIVVPLELTPVYPQLVKPLLYLSPLAIIAFFYAVVALFRKRRIGLQVSFISFVLFLTPTFAGLSTGLQPLADRYTYLATIPVFLFVGGCGEWLWRKTSASPGRLFQRELIFAVLFVICGVIAYRSINHTAVWNNSIGLWHQAIRYAPTTREVYEERKPYFKPNYPDAMINLGTAYYSANEKEEAMKWFRQVVTLDPRNADGHYNLGILTYEQGNVDGAVLSFQNAVTCDRTYAKAYYNLGILLAQKDSMKVAVEHFRDAARLGYADAQQYLREKNLDW